MKQISLIIVLLGLLCPMGVGAAPAAPVPMEVSQPDGTTFIVYARGDEHANWTETADGYTVIKEGDTWFYAVSDAAGQLRAGNARVGSLSTAQKQQLSRHLAPPRQEEDEPRTLRKISRSYTATGDGPDQPQAITHTQYVLVILANYADTPFTYSDASFQSLFFGASNSVKHFYLENSYNGFNIMPAAESFGTPNDGVVRITRPGDHPNQGGNVATSRSQALAIVNATNRYVNYASFDTNGDGFISSDELAIVIIIAGYETSYGGTANALTPNVWGHQSYFATQLALDGKNLQPYTMFGERHGTASGTHQATIGIMAHELGHLMLGLPDLYDTDGSSYGIGIWSLMASGSWNRLSGFSGESPAHMDAWSKVVTGFTLAEDIDTAQNGVSIAQAETNEVAKRLWIDKYKINEYFLLENRQQTGYDAGLPGTGLLIWHVDETRTSNANENRKLVDLEEADGLNQLDNLTSSGNGGDPYPGTTGNTTFNDLSNPNSRRYSGARTNVGVSSISASSATMTANVVASPFITGDHVRYDEYVTGYRLGNNTTTIWAGLRTLNNTAHQSFDGVDIYVTDSVGATIDIYYYSSMSGGTPSGLIHSQTGFVAGPGRNRLLLNAPQSFPLGAERGVVLRIVNNSNVSPFSWDNRGPASGRSYISNNGSGTFSTLCPSYCGDLNMAVLLSTNAPPVFTPVSDLVRLQGSPAGAAVAVGTVGDSDTAAGSLAVSQIAGGTATGITVTGVSNSNGNVTATIAASCSAASGTVRFQVSDGSLTATGDLQVNVSANTQPTLSYGARTLNYAGSGTHAAATGPSDNGSVSSIVVHSSGSYSGNISVNSAGLVTLSNAQPPGTHAITIRATDNCGAIRDAGFQLQVDAVLPGAPTMGSATAGNTEATVSFTAPAFTGGATIDSYTVTSNPGSLTGTGTDSPITVAGLSNGQAYTFTVTATNSAGTGPASAASNAVTPMAEQSIEFANPGDQDFGTTPLLAAMATSGLPVSFSSNSGAVCTVSPEGLLSFVTTGTCSIDADQAGNAAFLPASTITQSFAVNAVIPAAPLIGVATAGDEEATVSFTPPAFDGGSSIISYTATSSPDGLTGTAVGSPITVAGLTNGQAYTFTVTATNSAGTGPASAESNAVTPIAAQHIVFAHPGDQEFGTSPLLTASATSSLPVSFSSNSSEVCTVTPEGTLSFVGIGNCSIDVSQAGDAAWLPAPTITLSFTVNAVRPAAPVIGVAIAGNGETSVSFTPPVFSGGAAITSYTVTSNPDGFTGLGTGSPVTVEGLTNGQPYTFTVTATNSAGTGPASDPSNEVTPKAPPPEEIFIDGFESE